MSVKESNMGDVKKKEEPKVENRRDFLKRVSKWSAIALGTAAGITTISSLGCPPYDDYFGCYCDGWGQDYYSYYAYCNYTNYGDW
jgi:hypothetical protein